MKEEIKIKFLDIILVKLNVTRTDIMYEFNNNYYYKRHLPNYNLPKNKPNYLQYLIIYIFNFVKNKYMRYYYFITTSI